MRASSVRIAPRWLAPVLVGAVSLVLGVITLGEKSLWFDEAFNAEQIRGTWGSAIRVVGGEEMSQAVYLIVLKSWGELTSFDEAWLRFPSVVAAALAAALLVPLGARLFDRTTGIVAGLLLATNEFLVRWSQQARTYALVTLAVIVATALFVRALDNPRRRNWLIYAFAAAFAVYCHFFAGFVIVAHFASLPFAPNRPSRRQVVETTATFAALIVPCVYYTATEASGHIDWIPESSVERLRELLTEVSGSNRALEVAVAAGLVILANQARVGAVADRWRAALVGGWVVLPVALCLLISELRPILFPRYLIVITPALALAGAVAIAAIARIRWGLAACALAAVLAISGQHIRNWYGSPPVEDWRAAAAFIAKQRDPADPVFVTPDWAAAAYHYYDASTSVTTTASPTRAFVVVRLGEPSEDAHIANELVGSTGLPFARAQAFGRDLSVRVYEHRP